MVRNISKISINASLQKVWDIITTPEGVKQWQYGSELHTTWEVGTPIKFVTAWDGKIFEQWGTVQEFSPITSLRYSLFAPRPGLEDKPENYFVMQYTLTVANEQTILEIIQEDNRLHALQENEQGEENPVLNMLKHLAEME